MPFVGVAALTASLTASGEAESFRVPDRWGNHNYRATGSFQSYSVTGSLEPPGDRAFDLGACLASRIDQTHFSNQAEGVGRALELAPPVVQLGIR